MSLINDLIPGNTEAVRLGAQRIRETRTAFNTLLGLIFADSVGTFQSKWITGSMIQGDPVDDLLRAVSSDNLKDGSVTTPKLAANVLSADVAGREKMADGFVTSVKLAPDISIIGARVAIGAYAGAAGPVTVSGLTFAPDAVLLTRGIGLNGLAIGFKLESGRLHNVTGDETYPANTIQWNSEGFTIIPSLIGVNTFGQSHSYIAIKAS